jgi:hypothetical protein
MRALCAAALLINLGAVWYLIRLGVSPVFPAFCLVTLVAVLLNLRSSGI